MEDAKRIALDAIAGLIVHFTVRGLSTGSTAVTDQSTCGSEHGLGA